jgi:threonine/homoserine/homoserine lactone efflux protein
MLLIVGLGLAKVFIAVPAVHLVFKYISIVYLLYLAWRIATAAAIGAEQGTARPMTFMQAAAFQWINIKAWITSVSAVTTYTVVNSSLPWQIGAMAILAVITALASASCWTLFGHFLRDYLHTDSRRRTFNLGMAALLGLSIIPVFLE